MKIYQINVPEHIKAEELQEILLPLGIILSDEDGKESLLNKKKLKEILLNAPTMTEEQLKIYEDNREYLNKWKIN